MGRAGRGAAEAAEGIHIDICPAPRAIGSTGPRVATVVVTRALKDAPDSGSYAIIDLMSSMASAFVSTPSFS